MLCAAYVTMCRIYSHHCVEVYVCVYVQLDVKSRQTQIHTRSECSDSSEESYHTVTLRKVCSSPSWSLQYQLANFQFLFFLCFTSHPSLYIFLHVPGFHWLDHLNTLQHLTLLCPVAPCTLIQFHFLFLLFSLNQYAVPWWQTQWRSFLMHVMRFVEVSLRHQMNQVWVMPPVIQSLRKTMVGINIQKI